MHVLFVHKNYPAQFGHIAKLIVEQLGWQATYVSELPDGEFDGVRRIACRARGGAAPRTHYLSRSFENYIWQSHAVYETLKSRGDVRPDIVVAHSGFGSSVFLADHYDCPIVNYCEYYYGAHDSDLDFRPEFPPSELDILRCRARNAMLLLDLQTCAAAYSPTEWQRSRFPAEYQPKIETIFDGIDTSFWRRCTPSRGEACKIGDRLVSSGVKVVTYVSRGFESLRGFDVFMKVAKRIYQQRDDVVFVCVGSDRICYGGDAAFLKGKTFRQWVLAQEQYDLDKFIFTGMVPPLDLVRLLSRSDLHIYLTAPFVLSWSLFNAMACSCAVLGSDTAPVREVIRNGINGLLAGFFDVDRLSAMALDILDRPDDRGRLSAAAVETVERQFSLRQTFPRLISFLHKVADCYVPHELPSATEMGAARETMLPRDTPINVHRPALALTPPPTQGDLKTPHTKILITIAHYYDPDGPRRHGSSSDPPEVRARALRRCVAALHELYGGMQYCTSFLSAERPMANESTALSVDVAICTSGNRHLLESAALPSQYYRHLSFGCDARVLGFECQRFLADALGCYDFYCFMEDDLQLHDPWFFAKLTTFTNVAGGERLLQPNRYEGVHGVPPRKVYIDGDLPAEMLAGGRCAEPKEIELAFLGKPVVCRHAVNPHAGCYFLNQSQMRHWAVQPGFGRADRTFVGPLESAATLGIMRAFTIYKPDPSSANFLEVQHYGSRHMQFFARREIAPS